MGGGSARLVLGPGGTCVSVENRYHLWRSLGSPASRQLSGQPIRVHTGREPQSHLALAPDVVDRIRASITRESQPCPFLLAHQPR